MPTIAKHQVQNKNEKKSSLSLKNSQFNRKTDLLRNGEITGLQKWRE